MGGMGDYGSVPAKPLTKPEKAAAILLAMGKPVAGKLLKYFEQSELQIVIGHAQSLRSVPPDELTELVAEFEELFTEGAGLMDNAKAMEGILEEGLSPDEVDGLLGRATAFQGYQATVWDRLQEMEVAKLGKFLEAESAQTVAYIVSMLPSGFAGKTLLQLPEDKRGEVIHRTVNMKQINPRVAQIIEAKVGDLLAAYEAEKNSAGSIKVANLMNELDKPNVDQLLGALETISRQDVEKVRPRIFLFDDLVFMPLKSRVTLFNDIGGDVLTTALRGAPDTVREAVLSAIGARQRRMIESDLAAPNDTVRERDIAVARRSITQEAIRLANLDQIVLKEEPQAAAA